MLTVKKIKTHGFEMIEVSWTEPETGRQSNQFWSIEFAKIFIARKWPHINLDRLEIEG